MDTIETLRDSIRSLEEKVRLLETKDIDMKQRRITNAQDSVDAQDYTTKAEVLRLLGSEDIEEISTPGIVIVDVSLSALVVADDISPPRPVVYLPRDLKGIPVFAGVRLLTAPSGGDFSIRWNHWSFESGVKTDLFNDELMTIEGGNNWAQLASFTPNRNIAFRDWFTFDLTQVNSAAGMYSFLALRVE